MTKSNSPVRIISDRPLSNARKNPIDADWPEGGIFPRWKYFKRLLLFSFGRDKKLLRISGLLKSRKRRLRFFVIAAVDLKRRMDPVLGEFWPDFSIGHKPKAFSCDCPNAFSVLSSLMPPKPSDVLIEATLCCELPIPGFRFVWAELRGGIKPFSFLSDASSSRPN